MVKSPSLSSASVDRSSNNSSIPPRVPNSPPKHYQDVYQRMDHNDEQLVARYSHGRDGGGPPPSNYNLYPSYSHQQQHSGGQPRYNTSNGYAPSPGHYGSASDNTPPAADQVPRNSFPPPPPGGAGNFQIVHTDDAATKLSDRVRRRCFNCCTTETSTWRRSSLNPGKVVSCSPVRIGKSSRREKNRALTENQCFTVV
jgi:hypothetical protein